MADLSAIVLKRDSELILPTGRTGASWRVAELQEQRSLVGVEHLGAN